MVLLCFDDRRALRSIISTPDTPELI